MMNRLHTSDKVMIYRYYSPEEPPTLRVCGRIYTEDGLQASILIEVLAILSSLNDTVPNIQFLNRL
jgi:hypothetical protein